MSPHDCAGSNLYAHVLRGKLRRIVPRDNEAINEAWIADRDRFGCYGVYSNDRLQTPRIKRDGEWTEVSWQDALVATVAALKTATKSGGDQLGTLVSPSATLEEHYLLARITRHLGSNNIDHRLRQRDFRDQASDPVAPLLGCSIADIDTRRGHSRRRLEPAYGGADRRAPRTQGRAQGRERRVREPGRIRISLQDGRVRHGG